MTTAQQIAEFFDNDGSISRKGGVSLDEKCVIAGGVEDYSSDHLFWRYEFDDGSALTGNCDGWGVEGATHFTIAVADVTAEADADWMSREQHIALPDEFGDIVRSARQRESLTMEEAGALAGIGKGHICDIEHGDIDPRLSTVIKICCALHLNLSVGIK